MLYLLEADSEPCQISFVEIHNGWRLFNFLIKFIHSFITFEKKNFKALVMTLFLTKVEKNITQVIIPYIHT